MHTTPGRRPSSAPASEPSRRFVDAALTLFIEHGYSGTSLQMIGDSLGVSKAAVTYHFKSKEELLAAVVAPAFEDLGQLLDQVECVRRESTRRREALHAYIDYLIRQRRVASWLSRDVSAVTHPVVLEPGQALTGRIDALLVADSDDALGRIWGAAISQALTGPILNEISVSDDELRQQLESIGETLIRGYQTARRRALAPST